MEDITKRLIREEHEKKLRWYLIKNIPGNLRNIKCPCGSLRKAKNCECDTFKEKL